jgi:predicted Zn-dependent protease with MMP-like domain
MDFNVPATMKSDGPPLAAEFDFVVERALRRIPRRFRKLLDNIVVVVEEKPPRPNLLGLYRGRPRTVRGVSNSFAMPDQITIYQRPHEQLARDVAELEQLVADTVWHEVGHYFGMSESQIRQAERRIARSRCSGN